MSKRNNKGALPPLSDKSPGKPKGNRYREQYGVIVICEDEKHHKKTYEALCAQGFNCRVVRT